MSATPPSSSGDHRRAAVALAFARGVGCCAFRERVGRYGSAAVAFEESVPRPAHQEALEMADRALAAADRIQARVLVLGEVDYPFSLLDLPDPPSILFTRGSAEALHGMCIGIVGTRRASVSGERAAHMLAGVLVQAGACVVSGMAKGIDGAAHRGAIDGGGLTIAVLGGGVDMPYPPRHRSLYEAILERGAVVSEALPGSHPLPGAFPRRNRIIAALSRALVVIEAGDRSGALITADQALELGRAVGATPGPIDAPQCVGSNALLASGAAIITSPDDLLVFAGLGTRRAESCPRRRDTSSTARSALSTPTTNAGLAMAVARADPSEAAVMAAVQSGASTPADVARHTKLTPRDLAAALSGLELAGILRTDHAGDVRLAG